MVNKSFIRPYFWGGTLKGGVGWLAINDGWTTTSTWLVAGACEGRYPSQRSWGGRNFCTVLGVCGASAGSIVNYTFIIHSYLFIYFIYIYLFLHLEPSRPFLGGLTFYFVKSENIFVYKYIIWNKYIICVYWFQLARLLVHFFTKKNMFKEKHPSNHPTIQPSNHPTIQPSNHPTSNQLTRPVS